jgi:hypothetical protein
VAILAGAKARERGGQGLDRTADLPLFRIKERCPRLAMLVSLPGGARSIVADRRTYTQMYKTRNETAFGTSRTHRARTKAARAASSWGERQKPDVGTSPNCVEP